jgi:hypothetical protein
MTYLQAAATRTILGIALLSSWAPVALPQNDADLAAIGIRAIEGKHIKIYTDLPPSKAVDELPKVFDSAVPSLEKYFSLQPKTLDSWRVRAMIMRKENSDLFTRVKLLPTDLPPFLHGFARKRDLWVYEQPSDYYRRHLLLHEGVHALMAEFLHGMGPPWYAEGMAELLATHLWKDEKLTLKYFPQSREEVPEWGRVKVLRDAVSAKEIPTLDQIFAYDQSAHRVVPPYAWSWAATTFFETNPKYAKAFAELQQHTTLEDDEFNADFRKKLQSNWTLLAHEWQSFVSEADYGCDVSRTYLTTTPIKPATAGGKVAMKADQSWQSTGLKLEAGKTYKISIYGKFVIRQSPSKWESEPSGVTIHYHRGNPLAMVMGAMLDESSEPQPISPLLNGAPLGLGREFTSQKSGILYLRVNEPASGLSDNQGEFFVEVQEKK